jgi:hypothetical protein
MTTNDNEADPGLERRVPCSDGTCTGIIRADGKCGYCGKNERGEVVEGVYAGDIRGEDNVGEAQSETKICSFCGKEIKYKSIICRYCKGYLKEKKPYPSCDGSVLHKGRRGSEMGKTIEPGPPVRSCEHCLQLIPEEALRCFYCRKWRRDVDRVRKLSYLWFGLTIIPLVVFLVGIGGRWWHVWLGGSDAFLLRSPWESDPSMHLVFSWMPFWVPRLDG